MLPEPHTVDEAVTWNEGYRSYPGRSARNAPDKRHQRNVTGVSGIGLVTPLLPDCEQI